LKDCNEKSCYGERGEEGGWATEDILGLREGRGRGGDCRFHATRRAKEKENCDKRWKSPWTERVCVLEKILRESTLHSVPKKDERGTRKEEGESPFRSRFLSRGREKRPISEGGYKISTTLEGEIKWGNYDPMWGAMNFSGSLWRRRICLLFSLRHHGKEEEEVCGQERKKKRAIAPHIFPRKPEQGMPRGKKGDSSKSFWKKKERKGKRKRDIASSPEGGRG